MLPTTLGNLGVLICYIAGSVLNWSELSCVASLLPIPFLVRSLESRNKVIKSNVCKVDDVANTRVSCISAEPKQAQGSETLLHLVQWRDGGECGEVQ